MRRLDLDNAAACAEWDAFCVAQARPSLFHSSPWARVIRRVYGAECRSVAWERDGRLDVAFPVFQVRNLLGRSVRASVPYGPYGGVLTTATGTTVDFLNGRRDLEPEAAWGGPDLLVREVCPTAAPATADHDRITMWLDLPPDADTLWKGFSAKVRNQVRKAETQGVTVKTGPDLIEDFYGLYARRMHELGTPAHGRGFFLALSAEFGAAAEFIVAHHEGTPVAAVFDVGWGDFRVNLYGASDYARRSLCANNLVYWESLRRAVMQGKRRYDFGRSLEGSGQHKFKEQWGAQAVPVRERRLRFDVATRRWEERPGPGHDSRLAGVWRHLPGFVVRALATRLRRYVY